MAIASAKLVILYKPYFFIGFYLIIRKLVLVLLTQIRYYSCQHNLFHFSMIFCHLFIRVCVMPVGTVFILMSL